MKKYFYNIITFLLVANLLVAQNLKVTPNPIDASLTAANNAVMLKGPSVLADVNNMVWCGSVVKVHDSLYYMFYSTWSCGTDSVGFYDSWVLESTIALAVSKHADKNFKPIKTILKGTRHHGDTSAWDAQMVHNPHIQFFNNKYYLYYIGAKDYGKQTDSSAATLNKRNRVQQMQKIGVIVVDSIAQFISGNFKRSQVPILEASTRVKKNNVLFPSPKGTVAAPDNIVVVNPTVVYNPNTQKYMLYFKGNWYDPTWRGVHGIALSNNPDGPFEKKSELMFEIKNKDGSIASAEDPFVWYSKKHDKFYAILKDFTGAITGDKASIALLQSNDGLQWKRSKTPQFLDKQITLKNGSIIKLYHLERPFLLLNDNGLPTVFYGATAINSPTASKITGTFNVHIPLTVKD